MNRASRIKLAKELLCCAKMVLDAVNGNDKNRTAKHIIADYAYDKFKKYISEYRVKSDSETLVDSMKRYDFEQLPDSGYVIHHFDYPTTHYIESGKPAQKYQIYIDILQGNRKNPKMKKALESQINHIVLLPAWFHNYIKYVDQVNGYTTREQFYDLMESVLLTEQAYDKITALKFDGSSVVSALKSIRNLAMINNEASTDIIKSLRSLYKNVQDNLIHRLTN